MKIKKDLLKDIAKIVIPLIIVLMIFSGAVAMGIITFEKTEQNNDEVAATVMINYGDGDIDSYEITTRNATVYGFLIEAASIGGFSIEATYYGQYDSLLVDSINSYAGGQDGKYWQYYMNDEYGVVGADKQTVKNGDIIKWKFEEFQF